MARPVGDARIGIAGLGGMGSNTAVMLARAGVGTLVLADFDLVDATNVARQAYLPSDVGSRKTEALVGILRSIRPDIGLEPHDVRLDPGNACRVFAGCDVVCEALDDPGQKAMLVEALLSGMPGTPVVACSGMAGAGSANDIATRRAMSGLYVCGDGATDAADERLTAPRVGVCAGHMAMAVLRILSGQEPR